jgi:dihydrolipoamide dehydrogenase
MSSHIVVIGAGPGGYTAAVRAARLGRWVTLVEREHLGGVCLNWGCIPTKTLLQSTEVLHLARRAEQFGLTFQGSLQPDPAAMRSRKEEVIGRQRKGIEQLLKKNGVETVFGRAELTARGELTVHSGAGEQRLTYDGLILATGSSPLELPGVPFDGQHVWDSNQALELDELPRSLLIVGGGVIGCEFAFIFHRLGVEVTVVEMMDRLLPLPVVDGECSKLLQREMKKEKIRFFVGKSVASCHRSGDGLEVEIVPAGREAGSGQARPEVLSVEKMLVCIGRRPNTDGLGLERIGVETDERGWILADERMQTSADKVYAIGDALGPAKVMLAHAASAEGLVAAENLCGDSKRMEYDGIPGAIFTHPEVGHVGLSEEQAKEQGLDYRADTVLYRTLGKAQASGDLAGQAKLISEKGSGRILGVHLIGAQATELIAEAVLALKAGCTVQDVAETIHAHPTLAEIMGEAAAKAAGRAIHA